jgi:hypothetical protein
MHGDIRSNPETDRYCWPKLMHYVSVGERGQASVPAQDAWSMCTDDCNRSVEFTGQLA